MIRMGHPLIIRASKWAKPGTLPVAGLPMRRFGLRPRECRPASIRPAIGWAVGGPGCTAKRAPHLTPPSPPIRPGSRRARRGAGDRASSFRTRPRWLPGRNPGHGRPARPGEAASPDAGEGATAPPGPLRPSRPDRTGPRAPPPPSRTGREPAFDPHPAEGRWRHGFPPCLRRSTFPRASLRTVLTRTPSRSAGTRRQAAPSAPRPTPRTPSDMGARARRTAPGATSREPGGSRRGMSPLGTVGKPAVDRRCPSLRPRREEAYLRAPCGRGGIGRHARFRIWCRKAWGFESLRPHTVPHTSTTTWKSSRRTSTR